jgi:hypothetical protein
MAVGGRARGKEQRPTLDSRPARTVLQWLEIVILGLVLVGLVVLFYKGISTSVNGDVTQCAKAVDPNSPIGPFLALIAVSGFAVGRAVANARKWIHQAPAVSDSKVVRTDGFLQGGLAVFLLLAAVLLGYETFAVSGFSNVPPITEYVRCAAGTEPWLSGIGTAAISILLGNWLWYPTR